jgi:recombination protein RecT
MTSQQVAIRDHVAEVCTTIASPEFGHKIAQALPSNITLDRFTRVTLTAIQQNPELVSVDRQSLYNSVVRCAQDGLIPDGREAALTIRKDKQKGQIACYMPMIGGYRKIAAKHGYILEAFVVYDGDEFDYTLGFDPSVSHRPPKLGIERGAAIGAYAVATRLADGRKFLGEPMSVAEIEKVRDVSMMSKSEYGPWAKWWDRMACKTVARRLFKTLPLGDLDEHDNRVIAAADDEADLPTDTRMTRDQANVAAALTTAVPSDDGPDDTVEVLTPAAEDVQEPPVESLFQPPAGVRGGKTES